MDASGDAGDYAHIVGNGINADYRSNAHTLDWDGNAWFAGNVCAQSIILTAHNNPNVKFKIQIDEDGRLTSTKLEGVNE